MWQKRSHFQERREIKRNMWLLSLDWEHLVSTHILCARMDVLNITITDIRHWYIKFMWRNAVSTQAAGRISSLRLEQVHTSIYIDKFYDPTFFVNWKYNGWIKKKHLLPFINKLFQVKYRYVCNVLLQFHYFWCLLLNFVYLILIISPTRLVDLNASLLLTGCCVYWLLTFMLRKFQFCTRCIVFFFMKFMKLKADGSHSHYTNCLC